MQKVLSKAESLVSKLKPRHLIAAFFLLLAAFILLWSASRIKEVTIYVDDEKTVVVTALASPYRVLEEQGIVLENDDILTYTGFGNGGMFGELGQNKAEIRIQCAVDVKILADDLTYHVTVAEGDTVGDALDISGLELREHDILSADEDKVLEEDEKVKITRVDYIITTEEETIQRGKTVRGTSLIKGNKETIISFIVCENSSFVLINCFYYFYIWFFIRTTCKE